MRTASREVCLQMKQELTAFRFLDPADISVLAPYFECRQVEAGETLWEEGDGCDYLVFVMEGRLEIKKETEFKGKQVIVGVYGRGNIAGELCILDGSPRPVTVAALEDSNLLLLTRDRFEGILKEYPELGVKLLKGMLMAVSIRLRKSFDRLAAIF